MRQERERGIKMDLFTAGEASRGRKRKGRRARGPARRQAKRKTFTATLSPCPGPPTNVSICVPLV